MYVSAYYIISGLTCVNGITYMPVLKLFQGLGQRQRYFIGNFKVNLHNCELGNSI